MVVDGKMEILPMMYLALSYDHRIIDGKESVGFLVTIKELLELIVELTEFEGEIIWDSSKPDGQPRRALDVTKAKEEFGFTSQMDFREGLKRTIDWYIETSTQTTA